MKPIDHKNTCASQAPNDSLTLLYDGDCPMCAREVAWLKRRDEDDRLTAVDISAADFTAAEYNRSRQQLMERMHAVLPDGQIISGVEVFRQAYARVGLGWLLAPTKLPLLRQVSDAAYAVFARYRVPLGRALERVFGRKR